VTVNDGKWNDAGDRIVGTEHQAVGPDGVDRRGFLKCMAWAGTGLAWSFIGGIPVSRAFGSTKHGERPADFNFVQISDSHRRLNKPVNTDVTATLQAALDKSASIKLPRISSFIPATPPTARKLRVRQSRTGSAGNQEAGVLRPR
jgi:hypothetical protein